MSRNIIYAKKLKKSKAVMKKLNVIAKIREDYYDNQIKQIETSDETPNEKANKIKNVQERRNQDKGLGTIPVELEDFKNQLMSEVSGIEEIKK